MQNIKLIADFVLPGSTGARTSDINTIQKNILVIQQCLGEKIYKPGDIGNTRVLVVTDVYNYVCIISLQLLELTGYMSFISCAVNELQVMGIFRALCPSVGHNEEQMETQFLAAYKKAKYKMGSLANALLFAHKMPMPFGELVY